MTYHEYIMQPALKAVIQPLIALPKEWQAGDRCVVAAPPRILDRYRYAIIMMTQARALEDDKWKQRYRQTVAGAPGFPLEGVYRRIRYRNSGPKTYSLHLVDVAVFPCAFYLQLSTLDLAEAKTKLSSCRRDMFPV